MHTHENWLKIAIGEAVDHQRRNNAELDALIMDLKKAEEILTSLTGKPSVATVESAIQVANIEAARSMGL